jgi:hypothetical protein
MGTARTATTLNQVSHSGCIGSMNRIRLPELRCRRNEGQQKRGGYQAIWKILPGARGCRQHYQGLLASTVTIHITRAEFNRLFKWAIVGTDRCTYTPGIGMGLLAGFSRRRVVGMVLRESGRPVRMVLQAGLGIVGLRWMTTAIARRSNTADLLKTIRTGMERYSRSPQAVRFILMPLMRRPSTSCLPATIFALRGI